MTQRRGQDLQTLKSLVSANQRYVHSWHLHQTGGYFKLQGFQTADRSSILWGDFQPSCEAGPSQADFVAGLELRNVR